MAKHLNVSLAFTADTGQAKSQIQELQRALSDLSTGKTAANSLGISQELAKARAEATRLGAVLKTSLTPEGTLDLNKFNQNLNASGKTLTEYGQSLKKLGPDGQKAFAQVARSVTTANVSFQKTNGLLSEMWTTMKNTARWQITSSVLHGLMGGLQSAIGYAKDLNKTLTDIRIVAPEKSIEDMAQFAKLANKQAKELSSTTLDYAKGALIYYQQGLEDAEVKARTDVTTKMSNVTGDSTDDVSSYMTAIWNNFNKAGDESEEHFADILTKLGAETAASTTEITTSLEKYSAVAGTIGLSYEAATAAATTLIDRTREAPEVAGTALKTIFARIEGLKQEGSTDEGGTTTTLNKYSQALHNVGVEIKDQNGEMRQADQIIDDIGAKWKDLSQDQKIALAETVAGVRQWNQFAALMDNFDYYKKFKDMASFDSDGALQEQQDIYAESWEAASNRVKSSVQSIYMSLLDDQFFIKLTNGIGKLVESINTLLSSVGGFKTILPGLGLLMTKAFGEGMAKNIDRTVQNMALMTKAGRKQIYDLRKEATKNLVNAVSDGSLSGNVQAAGFKREGELTEKLIDKQKELADKKIKMTELEKNHAAAILDSVRGLNDQATAQAKILEEGKKQDDQQSRKIKRGLIDDLGRQSGGQTYAQFVKAQRDLKKALYTKDAVGQLQGTFATSKDQGIDVAKQKLQQAFKGIETSANQAGIKLSKDFTSTFNKAMNDSSISVERLEAVLNQMAKEAAQSLGQADAAVEKLSADLEKAGASGKTREAIRDAMDATEISADEAGQLSKNIQAAEDAAEEGEKAFNKFGTGVQSFGTQMTQLAGTAMTVAMAIEAFQNAIEVFSDPDATFMEQLIASLMAIGMILPALTMAFDTLRLSSLKQIPISLAVAVGFNVEAAAATEAAGEVTVLSAAMTKLWAVLAPILPIIIAVAAAIAAIAGVIYYLYQKTHHANKTFKELSTAAEDTADSVSKLTSSFKEVLDVMNSFEDKRSALDDMKQGTAEWAQAASELNSNMQDSIEKFNNLNDNVGKADLDKLNAHLTDEEKEIVGENGFSQADLIYGEDWAYDSQGIPYYTDVGQLKIDKITALSIQQANVTMNQATIAEDYASLDKKVEDFTNAGLFGGKNYKQSDAYYAAHPETTGLEKMMGVELPKEVFEALGEGIKNGDFLTSDLEKGIYDREGNLLEGDNKVVDYLQDYLGMDLENAQAIADLIATNKEELASVIGEYGESWKQINEKAGGLLAANLASDTSYQADLKEKMGEEDYEKYGQMVTNLAGEAAASFREQLLNQSETLAGAQQALYGKDKTWEDYKDAYASEHSIYKDEKGDYYKTDEQGNPTEETANITESAVKDWLATSKAEEHAKDELEQYLKTVEKTKENLKAYEDLKKMWKEQGEEISELAKNWKNLSKEAKSDAWKKFSQFADNIRDSFSDVLDMDLKNSVFDGKFVKKNLKDIEDAMKGDADAAERVRQAYAEADWENIEAKIEPRMDDVHFKGDLESMVEAAHAAYTSLSQELGNIPAGADLSGYRGALEELINMTSKTKADAEATLSNLGVDAEVEQVEVPAEEYDDIYPNVSFEEGEGVTLDNFTMSAGVSGYSTANFTVPTVNGDDIGSKTEPIKIPNIKTTWKKAGSEDLKGVKSKLDGYETATTHKEGQTITAWRLKPASEGGSITKKGTGTLTGGGPSGGRRRAPGGGGGGGGGGRRGGGRRARAARHEVSENKIDRYHDVTGTIEKIKRAQEKQSDLNDKLYGKKRLSNMDKVNQKLKEELKAIQAKNKLTNTYIALERDRLNQELKYYQNKKKKDKDGVQWGKITDVLGNKTFEFDEFGNITNYNKIMDELQKRRDQYVKEMNNQKNEDKQKDYKEKWLDPLDEIIDHLQGFVDAYEAELQTLLDQIDDWSEQYNQILENNLEAANYEIEFRLSINDAAQSWIDYYLGKIEDDIYKIGELYNKLFIDNDSALANLIDKTNIYTDKIYKDAFNPNAQTETENYLEHITKLYQSGQITQAGYVEGLQSEYDALLDNASALEDLKNKMEDYYSNVLGQVMDSLENYINRIEYGTDALNHLMNIMTLTADGKNYKNLIDLQTKVVAQAERKYNNSLSIYQNLLEEYERVKAEFDATIFIDEEAKKKSEDELNDFLNQVQEAGADVMTNYENMLDAAQQLLETKLESAAKDVEEMISGVSGGFEELTRQMDLSSNRQDEYLTKTNQVYEMNKMLRTLRADIDKTDNKAAKQRLGNFAKELEQLKQKDELSQLELDIAQARYKQLQAQIALEEAQNAKSTVRLMRDNEGNYGYVYTANEDKVSDAQQALEDATNALYNIYLNAENDYNQKIINYASDMYKAIKEIQENTNLTEGEKADRITKIREQYGKLIDDATDLLGIANQGLVNEFSAYTEAWTNEYDETVGNILNNLDDGVNDWLNQINVIKDEYQKLQDKYLDIMNQVVDKALDIADQGQEEFETELVKMFGPDGVMDQAFESLYNFLTDNEKGLPGINTAIKNIEDIIKDLYQRMFNETFNQGAVDSFYHYNKLLTYVKDYNDAGEMKYNSNGALNFTNSNLNFGDKQTNIDEKTAEEIWHLIELGARGYIGLDKDGKLGYLKNADGRKDENAYKATKKALEDKGYTALLRFASGGYTGEWGTEEGKLAMLHEKELVLNQKDTENMLAAVDLVRDIVQMIDMNVLSTAANISATNINPFNQELDQNVTITAEFPNATDRNEIEAAFENLVNRAAQYANRN